MAKMRSFLFILIGLGAVSLFSSCLKGEESDTTLIGLALRSRTSPWWSEVSTYAVTQAALLHQPYFLANADSAAQQTPQLTKMRLSKIQALILADQGTPLDSVKKFIGNGTKVILLDCSMAVDYTCRISGDNAKAGSEAGNYIQQRLTSAHPLTLIIGVKAAPVDSIRREACKKALTGTTIESFVSNYNLSSGKTAMEEALKRTDADQIGAVYTTDDNLALGVLTALTEQGNTSIATLVGCGGTLSFLQKILSTTDRSLATAVYSPQIGVQAVEIAQQLLHGKAAPDSKEIAIEMPLADRSNAQKYITEGQ